MADGDQQRWNERYEKLTPLGAVSPPEVVTGHLSNLDPAAQVLDVACGLGDAGLWLSSRGAAVTFVDVSNVALSMVQDRAASLDLDVATMVTDLERSTPTGPWDAIAVVHYLDRELLGRLATSLAPGGRMAIAIATTTNLERHRRPSARFLLEPGELASGLHAGRVVHFDEAWRANGVHEAWLVVENDEVG